jgi:hypothetical protein
MFAVHGCCTWYDPFDNFDDLQNCNVEGNGIRDTVSAANLVQQVQFNGLTVRMPTPAMPAGLSRQYDGLVSSRACLVCSA